MNIKCRGDLPECVSQAPCSALLSTLLIEKGGNRHIAVGEVLGRLIAKGLSKKSNFETKEFFQSLQFGVGVNSGAVAIIHSTTLSCKKYSLCQVHWVNCKLTFAMHSIR